MGWLNPGAVAFIGAVLLVVGALWAFQRQAAKSEELARKSEQIADLNRKLAEKNDEIAVLVRNAAAAVTGGNTYAYLEPLRYPSGMAFFIRQSGGAPTFDVVVRVQNAAGDLLAGPVAVGTIVRGSGFDWTIPLPLQRWPLAFPEPPRTDATAQEFRVEIAARNGMVVQSLRVWPKDGRWHTDSKRAERTGAGPLNLPDFKEAQDQP
jgi:hypothetical protein